MAKRRTRKMSKKPVIVLAKKRTKVLVPLINKLAKRQALRQMETKFVTERNDQSFNSAIDTGFSEMYSLIPKVSEGLENWQRENDDLTPVNIRTNWHIALSTANRSMNIRVVLYCLQHKSIKHFPDLSPIVSLKHLKTGNGSGTPPGIQEYNGRIGDEDLPINKEEYTLLKCFKFNLMANVGTPNGDTTDGNSPNTIPSYKNLSFTYPCKRQLRYSPDGPGAGSAVYPNGHAPFWVLGYSHTDGTPADTLFQDVRVAWVTQMTYKDA